MRNLIRQSAPFAVLLGSATAGIVLFLSVEGTERSATESVSLLWWMSGVRSATVAGATGEARIDGRIEGEETGRTIAGLSCIACSSVLECPHRGRKNRIRWDVERTEGFVGPFAVRDDSGTLRVDPAAVMLIDDPDLVTTVSERTSVGTCRSREVPIIDGQVVSVVGCVSGTGDARVLGACGDRKAILARSADRARRILRGAAAGLAYLLLIPIPPLLAWGFVATRRPDRSRSSR